MPQTRVIVGSMGLVERSRAAVAVAAWLFLLLLAACAPTKSCGDVGSPNGLDVNIVGAASTQPPSGNYAISIVGDGTSMTLNFANASGRITCLNKDLTPQDAGAGIQPDCDAKAAHDGGELIAELHGQPLGSTSGPSLNIWTYHGELGVAKHIDLSIERDNQLVGKGSFTPTYTSAEVNGPGCGVTYSADALLVIQ